MLTRIIIGLIIVAVGTVIVMKAEWFYRNFGAIPWAEAHLHTEGGSRMMYKLIGILIIVIGFLIMTNMMTAILTAFFSRFFRLKT